MENQEVVKYNGKDMTAGGENGPFYDQGEAALTGFYGRKWLNPDPSFAAGEGKSAQPFILMRYAEVLLNAAEAAIELSMAGVTSPDGEDLLQLATKAVNDIRERAGATLLTSKLTATDGGRDIVRKERRKELAFEHKTKWDLRRWRVQHYETERDSGVKQEIKVSLAIIPNTVSVDYILSSQPKLVSISLTLVFSGLQTERPATVLSTTTSGYRVTK